MERFLSTLSLRRATIPHWGRNPGPRFLSTLSLRRATRISKNLMTCLIFLSTLSLRRATGIPVIFLGDNAISIHALLAESDSQCRTLASGIYDFYPRSPCGERPPRCRRHLKAPKFLSTLSLRRATMLSAIRTNCIMYFYPRSPCGERRSYYKALPEISIHALLAESDGIGLVFMWWGVRFLSTLSLRRATLTRY
mgnify:CR=1 FL=1